MTVEASGVTLKHDCVVDNGKEAEASAAIGLTNAASDFTVTESTIRGGNTTTESVEEALRNNYSDQRCGRDQRPDRKLRRVPTPGVDLGRQLRDLKRPGSCRGIRGRARRGLVVFQQHDLANHDTLLNPSKHTAVIFGESGGGKCVNHETLTNSLIAGGGYMLYFCQNTSGNSNSSVEIKNNRFARRVCVKGETVDVEGRGGYECTGKPSESESYFDAGEGSGGYFPRGGFFGAMKESEGLFDRGTGWEGNLWDNNLEVQPEQTYCPKC